MYAQGSNGRIGDDYVEVKTISPDKHSDAVKVKRKENFNKHVVVRVSEDYEFDSGMIDRRDLKKANGKFASVRYREMKNGDQDTG